MHVNLVFDARGRVVDSADRGSGVPFHIGAKWGCYYIDSKGYLRRHRVAARQRRPSEETSLVALLEAISAKLGNVRLHYADGQLWRFTPDRLTGALRVRQPATPDDAERDARRLMSVVDAAALSVPLSSGNLDLMRHRELAYMSRLRELVLAAHADHERRATDEKKSQSQRARRKRADRARRKRKARENGDGVA